MGVAGTAPAWRLRKKASRFSLSVPTVDDQFLAFRPVGSATQGAVDGQALHAEAGAMWPPDPVARAATALHIRRLVNPARFPLYPSYRMGRAGFISVSFSIASSKVGQHAADVAQHVVEGLASQVRQRSEMFSPRARGLFAPLHFAIASSLLLFICEVG